MRFDFSREEYEQLKEKMMLNEELSRIFEMKIKGYSNIQIGMELHLSDRTLARRIKELKKKIIKTM